MSVFLIYTFLFAVGGVAGWIIEVIFRRFVSQKHWVNPGFLTGPCLPLYGGSLCILYTLAELEGAINIEPAWLEKILLFLLMAIAITLLEYAVGTIMISTIHIRLWDYSECFGNIRGIICPRFTFYWGLLSAGYYFLVHPHIMDALDWLSHNLTFSFAIGFFYGILVIDLAYSTQKCNFFSPFVPYAYSSIEYRNRKKEEAMILAAPFDPRKGLADMPDLINPVAENLETLYIFGMPRCAVEEFNMFFKKLEVDHIVYYPFASSSGIVELYGRCKLLLFPSLNEGLGFPIIESQVCGCRVITTDKKPMNSLVLAGSALLKGTGIEDTETISNILEDDTFDFEELSKSAKERFSYMEVKRFFNKD